MPIKDIQQRYRELGRLRLGDTNERGLPTKIATWRLTSASAELLEKAAELWGGGVAVWENAPTEGRQFELTTETDELPVLVPPQDIDSNQWFELWTGGGCKRRCDGQTDFISGKRCICEGKDERDCKPSTQLLVMLPDIPDVGIWRLRTLGWNAAAELPQTVRILASLTEQRIPPEATLVIEQRTSKQDGQTHHFAVPVLRLPYTMAALIHSNHQLSTGERGRVPIVGRRPELPADAAFTDETDAAWGASPALPEESGVGESAETPPASDPSTAHQEADAAGDESPRSGGQAGGGGSAAYGKGVAGPPPTTFTDLAKRTGGRAKARALLNDTLGASFTAATVNGATEAELAAAWAAFQGVDA